MSEQSEVQKAGETSAPTARGQEEILADPRIAAAVAPVRSAVLEAREFAGEITLLIERRRIRDVCESFKRDGFSYLVDLTGVDYSKWPTPPGDLRFGVTYHLYSFDRKFRVRLKVRVADGVKVPSVSSVWKTANWPERETFDMFGIEFEGHPNLERILTWDGFNGHPLRKDFPIRGIDTGARIYPEVFPAGGGPKEGSTGKPEDDVNIYPGDWKAYGVSPPAGPPPPPKKAIAAPKPAAPAAAAAPKAAPAAPAAAPQAAAAAAAPALDAEAQKKKVQMESLEKRMDQIEAQLQKLTATIEKLAGSMAAGAPAAPIAGAPGVATPPAAPKAAPAEDAPKVAAPAPAAVPAPAAAAPAVSGASEPCPWHNDGLTLEERLALAKGKGINAELFASMAQTDCGACGWDCEGYAEALASGETNDVELCVPGDAETMDSLRQILTAAGKL